MLYDGNNPILKITAVEYMHWNGGVFNVKPRRHSALAFRISGKATIRTDTNEYFVNSSDILYLPQNIAYTAEYTDTEMLVIHFVTANDDTELEVYSFENTEQVYKLFLQAHYLWKNKEPGFRVYALSQLYMILGVMLEKSTKAKQPPHFLKAVSFINANYKNCDLGIDTVCSEAGIGATLFRQLFRKYYHKTPVQYITDLRLEHATSLISIGESIENAALASGFNDPKYFARVVKKCLNCTPRELRNYGR